MKRKMRIVPKNDDASVAPGLLLHLKDMKGFMIADPDSDIRGWEVALRDGRRVGVVDDLIVDTTQLEVRYIEVKVDRHVIAADEDIWVLVPASAARIHEKEDRVVIDSLPLAGLAGAPRSSRKPPTPDEERAVRDYFAPRMRREEEETLDYAYFWGRRNPARKNAPEPSSGKAEQGLNNA